MLKIMRYLKPYWASTVAVIALVFLQTMVNLQLPDYMSQIVNQGIVLSDNAAIISTGIKMLVYTVIGAICSVIIGFLAARVSACFSRDVRAGIFSKAEHFSIGEFNSFSPASLITRTTNDVQQVRMVILMGMRFMLMAPIMGVGALFKALQKSPDMTWIIALAVGILIVVMGIMLWLVLPRFKVLQKLMDRINLVARENLTGLRVIRAFNTESQEEEKFDRANTDLTRTNLFINRMMVMVQPMMTLIFSALAIGIIWVGAFRIDEGSMLIGDMLAFIQYSMQIMMAFMMLTMIFVMVPRAAVSAARVMEVLETENTVLDPENPKEPQPGMAGRIEFNNVSFGYPGAEDYVLKDVSFVAPSGKTTAFIGSTGCGKSTLINLIMRFYDVSDGSVMVGGTDIREMTQSSLRGRIGYVPQKGILFGGTIADNIRYGSETATDEEVGEAADISQAGEFISQKEEGFDYHIAQGGSNVSGGQRQRLSIARALVRKPEIFIFDDSFSALDSKTDRELRQALNKELSEATVLIVAQKISTILDADQIIVLERGKVVGSGTHRELLKSCVVYSEIAHSQLSEEELK